LTWNHGLSQTADCMVTDDDDDDDDDDRWV